MHRTMPVTSGLPRGPAYALLSNHGLQNPQPTSVQMKPDIREE